MALRLRPGTPADAPACAAICHAAFAGIAGRHNFPPDFPSPEAAQPLFAWMLARDDVHAVVAEADGRIVGSNFLWETAPIAGIGPITIDPGAQDGGIGRRLMTAVLERARQRDLPGVQLVQAGYHTRSLSLYTKLGFERGRDLRDAIAQGTATLVEHDGRVTGYATAIGFFGHALGESNADLEALIGAAPTFTGPGFLLPMRNGALFRWCLARGLRVVQPMTLMSLGLYNEPAGPFLPSILY